jgi:(2S)-methylsuccinyl-CoA dehydrogenase
VAAFLALALSDLANGSSDARPSGGRRDDWYEPFATFVATYRDPEFLASLAETPGPRHLGEDFADGRRHLPPLRPRAGAPPRRARAPGQRRHPRVGHRGTGELGGFGLSVPEEFGGFATGGESEYLGMVVATEELSWGALGVGGSLITRPEILTRALVNGGTKSRRSAGCRAGVAARSWPRSR